jgi:hypothetical protein
MLAAAAASSSELRTMPPASSPRARLPATRLLADLGQSELKAEDRSKVASRARREAQYRLCGRRTCSTTPIIRAGGALLLESSAHFGSAQGGIVKSASNEPRLCSMTCPTASTHSRSAVTPTPAAWANAPGASTVPPLSSQSEQGLASHCASGRASCCFFRTPIVRLRHTHRTIETYDDGTDEKFSTAFPCPHGIGKSRLRLGVSGDTCCSEATSSSPRTHPRKGTFAASFRLHS